LAVPIVVENKRTRGVRENGVRPEIQYMGASYDPSVHKTCALAFIIGFFAKIQYIKCCGSFNGYELDKPLGCQIFLVFFEKPRLSVPIYSTTLLDMLQQLKVICDYFCNRRDSVLLDKNAK
jgi:hypothetical protein